MEGRSRYGYVTASSFNIYLYISKNYLYAVFPFFFQFRSPDQNPVIRLNFIIITESLYYPVFSVFQPVRITDPDIKKPSSEIKSYSGLSLIIKLFRYKLRIYLKLSGFPPLHRTPPLSLSEDTRRLRR